jgi:hypothetical protein
VHPFWLVTESGVRVRVEPDLRVALRDAMSVTAHRVNHRRERTAELTEGEEVAILGDLSRQGGGGSAYRGGPESWTLSPPSEGRMLVSTEPLEQPHLAWASFYRLVALALTLTLIGISTLLYVHYYRFVLTGVVVAGHVVDRHDYLTHDRNGHHAEHHFVLVVEAPLPPPSERNVSFVRHVDVREYETVADGAEVPCIVTSDGHAMSGTSPRPEVVDVGLTVFTLAFVGVWLFTRFRATQPWYEVRRLRTEGRGRLDGSES